MKKDENQAVIIKTLGKHIQIDAMDHLSAINMHLLALYIQCMAKDELLQHYKIGRLFLRLAWLYREQPPESFAEAYGPCSNYLDFLTQMHGACDKLPLDELSAMKACVPHFEEALLSDKAFEDNLAYVTILGILTEVETRCGDLNAAMKKLRDRFRKGNEERNRLKAVISRKDAQTDVKRAANSKIQKIAKDLSEAAEVRTRLVDRLMERDQNLIDQTLAEMEGKDDEEIEAVLLEKGVQVEVITKLRNQGRIVKTKKKKGFLAWLGF